jgi:hypothetical protein
MGLLTNLVGMQRQYQQSKLDADTRAKEGFLDAAKFVLTDPASSDAAKAWARNSAVKLLSGIIDPAQAQGGKGKPGQKSKGQAAGGGIADFLKHGLLAGLTGGATNRDANQPSQQTQQALQQINRKRSLSNPYGRPGDASMALTTEQQQGRDEQTEMRAAKVKAKIDAANQAQKAYLDRQSDQDAYDDRVKQADAQHLEGRDRSIFVLTGKLPNEQKESATEKLVFDGPDGKELVLFRSPSSGKLFNLANREVPDPTARGYTLKSTGSQGDSGAELKEREAAEKIVADPKADPIRKKAAKDTLKHLNAVTQGATTRVVLEGLTAKDKGEQEAAAGDIAQGIIDGTIAPDRAGLGRNAGWMKVQSILEKKGFNLAKSELDWQAAKRYVGAMNSQQQIRIREAASTVSQMLPDLRAKYDSWKKAGAATGLKAFNRASLATAKNLPGPAGVAAQALDTQIADMTAELGQLYMGGNSPTDHALALAGRNLQGDWNEEQFNAALDLLHKNLGYRVNSIMNAGIAGMSEGSPYTPTGGAGVKTGEDKEYQGHTYHRDKAGDPWKLVK